jgi:hypothetical protein
MSTGQARISLSELRLKTDRELLTLARNEAERSLKLAKRGARAEAEAGSAHARTLLVLAGAARQDSAELESRLEEVATVLQRGRAAAAGRTQSAWF